MAAAPSYPPFDVVRHRALPCSLLADAYDDVEAGAPLLLAGWMGVTRDGDRCDLPYGARPPFGVFWYTRLGVRPGLRGATVLPTVEHAAAIVWLTEWSNDPARRCPPQVGTVR